MNTFLAVSFRLCNRKPRYGTYVCSTNYSTKYFLCSCLYCKWMYTIMVLLLIAIFICIIHWLLKCKYFAYFWKIMWHKMQKCHPLGGIHASYYKCCVNTCFIRSLLLHVLYYHCFRMLIFTLFNRRIF